MTEHSLHFKIRSKALLKVPLTLYNDYRYNDDFRSGYTFIGYPIPGINIKKSITINGNGHSIDGASKSILFWIESDNVKLTNLVLKNANASQSLI
ncbi:MAG: hypothetical protein UHG12_01775, partial [Methanobrevibacter sp.]